MSEEPRAESREDSERREQIDAWIAKTQRTFPTVPCIDVEELQQALAQDRVVLVDVRTPPERAVSGIPGAIGVEEFESRAAELAGAQVVTYCTIGYRSSRYAEKILRRGVGREEPERQHPLLDARRRRAGRPLRRADPAGPRGRQEVELRRRGLRARLVIRPLDAPRGAPHGTPTQGSERNSMYKLFLATALALSLTTGAARASEPLVELSGFRGNGGRVAWSPTGEFVVFDRREVDGGFDLYLTEDFETERCLTCDHPDLPNPKRNYGQPVVHPNGRYIVFQAEKQEHQFIVPMATNPGAGVFNDIWLYDLENDRARALRELPGDKHHGVLHPQFSKDGSMLSWSEMYEGIDFKHPGKGAGAWTLKVADFSPTGLSNIREYRPGEDVIYENHGFSHDREWLYFSSPMKRSEPVNESTNIYRIHLETQELERLTEEGYNEHAHLSPDGKYIVWMSSVGLGDSYDYYKVGADYWLMNADGSEKRRLTYLNDPDHPHFRGRFAVAADFDFDPRSPRDGSYRIVAYLHELVTKNFGRKPTTRGAKGEYNFFVDFTPGVPAGATPNVPTGAISKGNPMVHAEGARLVDESGEPLWLRGVNVEGWLIWTGHGWGGEFTSEQEIRDHLDATAGPAEAQRFEQAVYANFLTEEDIEMMAELGFNAVRVLFNHEILEEDERPFQYKESGWKLLDELLSWGERHGVYVVPCLIAAPGGQSSWFLADPDKKLLWDDPKRLNVAPWRSGAPSPSATTRRSIVAGFDLLNEPKTSKPEELVDLYKRIIGAIREVNPHHMIILEGTKSAMDFSMFEGPLDGNQMYSFHLPTPSPLLPIP